ncbi:hypothetical protein [Methanobrevibacter sp.]|uniref:hypothetical protein n=1 Tax=Methanobrevibacter sp. TaxID=66852 RepID=UPI00388DF756
MHRKQSTRQSILWTVVHTSIHMDYLKNCVPPENCADSGKITMLYAPDYVRRQLFFQNSGKSSPSSSP